MPDEDAIQRKRERLTVEMHEYFWNVCPELTAQWKQAMLTLPPSVLRDLAVEIQHLGAVTKWANQQLHAALGAGGEPPEDLLDRALASMENLRKAADDDPVARRAVEALVPRRFLVIETQRVRATELKICLAASRRRRPLWR
jgi:hypothetical protein